MVTQTMIETVLSIELIILGIFGILIQYYTQRKLIYSRELFFIIMTPLGFILFGLWLNMSNNISGPNLKIFTITTASILLILMSLGYYSHYSFFDSFEENYEVNMSKIGILFYSSSTEGVKLHENIWEQNILNFQEIEAQGAYFLSLVGAGSNYREGGFGPLPFAKDHVCWLFSKTYTYESSKDKRMQKNSLGLIVIVLPKRLKFRIKPKREYEKLLNSILENYEDVERIDKPLLERIKISFVFQKIKHTTPDTVKYQKS